MPDRFSRLSVRHPSGEIVIFEKSKRTIMGAAQIREELHQYINRADERVLNLIYAMMKADTGEEDFTVTEAHQQLLDERLEVHKSSPQEGSSWKDVKNRIMQKA